MRLTKKEKIVIKNLLGYEVAHYQGALKDTLEQLEYSKIDNWDAQRIKEYETSLKFYGKILKETQRIMEKLDKSLKDD
jgi:predicted alpha/beta hydrolase family esterase